MVIIFVGKRSQIIHLIFQGCSIATNPNNAALYPVPTPFSHRKKGKHAIHQAAKNTNRWWHWYQSFLHFSSNYLEYWCRYNERYTIVRCCVDTTPRRVCGRCWTMRWLISWKFRWNDCLMIEGWDWYWRNRIVDDLSASYGALRCFVCSYQAPTWLHHVRTPKPAAPWNNR